MTRRSRLLACSLLGLANNAVSQVTWHAIPPAPNATGNYAYEEIRARLVSVGFGSVFEFDGTTWSPAASIAVPTILWAIPRLGEVVFATDSGPPTFTQDIYVWDGASVSLRDVLPSVLALQVPLAAHPVFGIIVPWYSPSVQGLVLFAWAGSWAVLPTGLQTPPTVSGGPGGPFTYRYHSMTYDPTRGKLVMFGRSQVDPTGATVATEAITWEWDSLSGWTNLGTSGTVGETSTIWFDSHRGAIMRLDEGLAGGAMYQRTATGGWTSFPIQGSSPYLLSLYGYDPLRNRVFGVSSLTSTTPIGYWSDAFPASYDLHSGSCQHAQSPMMWLSNPASRAWLGGALSVDIAHPSSSVAGLTMGFDDQQFGGVSLPLPLAALGMPTCTLNVNPLVTMLAAIGGSTATIVVPIPNSVGLVGTTVFQQPFSLAPNANPAGLLLGYSTRAVVGRSQ